MKPDVLFAREGYEFVLFVVGFVLADFWVWVCLLLLTDWNICKCSSKGCLFD